MSVSRDNYKGDKMTKQEIAGVAKMIWDAMTPEEQATVTGRMYQTRVPLIGEVLQLAEG